MRVELVLTDQQVSMIAEQVSAIITETAPSCTEQWLTVEEAAIHLGISTSQLYSLCSARHTNGIPVTKEGSRSYFRASDLDRWRVRETR